MDKEVLMKIVSEISVSAPDGATIQISESNGKFIIELRPKAKAAADNKTKDDEPPSVVDAVGNKFWKNKYGWLHREGDLPAIIYADGSQHWYKDGLCHRDNDLPALIYAHGAKYWYKNNLRHRDDDKPAAIYANGSQLWYKNGLKHRTSNKPAVITKTKYEYWIDGKHILTVKHKDGVVEV